MATIAVIKVLVDETSVSNVHDSLNELLRQAQESENSNVLDWAIDDALPVHDALADSISNATYAEGDAFLNWVIYSPSQAKLSDDKAGFWSNEYGWTTLDLATRLTAQGPVNMVLSEENDAVLMLETQAIQLL